jgi:hypothetical protein
LRLEIDSEDFLGRADTLDCPIEGSADLGQLTRDQFPTLGLWIVIEVDLLLATANDPGITASVPSYPTAKAIAEAWNRAGRHVEYFWKNTDNGIRTFQDDEIRERLRPRGQG